MDKTEKETVDIIDESRGKIKQFKDETQSQIQRLKEDVSIQSE